MSDETARATESETNTAEENASVTPTATSVPSVPAVLPGKNKPSTPDKSKLAKAELAKAKKELTELAATNEQLEEQYRIQMSKNEILFRENLALKEKLDLIGTEYDEVIRSTINKLGSVINDATFAAHLIKK